MDKSFVKIEESYTIQLGAQLKTAHNLRLIRCDILGKILRDTLGRHILFGNAAIYFFERF